MFKPDKELFTIAVDACKDVYDNNHDLGTTEFDLFNAKYSGEDIQVLSIAGTNELKDWWRNLDLRSIDGIKRGSYKAAIEIFESDIFQERRNHKYRLLVTGHSKGAATAIAFNQLYCLPASDYCVAFAPARCLRYRSDRYMPNTTLFMDHDDPVPLIGFISFGLPLSNRVYLPNSGFGIEVMDHLISKYQKFVHEHLEPLF